MRFHDMMFCLISFVMLVIVIVCFSFFYFRFAEIEYDVLIVALGIFLIVFLVLWFCIDVDLVDESIDDEYYDDVSLSFFNNETNL